MALFYFGKNWRVVAVITCAFTVVAALYLFDPATSGIFPPCPLRYFTGWYCPGCGSLRAIHQLLHGNLSAALGLNPLTILLLPFIVYGITSFVMFEIRGQHLPSVFLRAACIRALCAVIVVFGIVRNLPFHPFDLLAPGGMLLP